MAAAHFSRKAKATARRPETGRLVKEIVRGFGKATDLDIDRHLGSQVL